MHYRSTRFYQILIKGLTLSLLLLVTTLTAYAQEVVEMYQIQNLISTPLLEKFKQVNPTIEVYDHGEANRLILKGQVEDIDIAIQQLELLDVQQMMVEIEFMLVEYFHGRDFDWSLDLTQGQFGSFNDIRVTTGALQGLEFLFNGVTRLSPSFKLNLSALTSENKAKIITNPHVVAQSGSNASFRIAEEIQVKLAEVNNNSGLILQRLQTISAGITLDITAIPTHNDIVHLDLNGIVSQFLPFSTEGEFRKQETSLNTSVDLKDGETLIIGGIIGEQDNEIDAGFPLLHRIPLLGYFFKRRKEVRDYTEKVIYLTPRIFTADDITKEKSLERYREVRQMTDLESEVSTTIETDPNLIKYTNTRKAFKRRKERRQNRKAQRREAREAINNENNSN